MQKLLVLAVVCTMSLTANLAFADRWEGGYDSLERQHNYWTRFSDDDIMLEYVRFRHGVKNGESQHYYPSENMSAFVKYQDGVLHGFYNEYYDDENETQKILGQHQNNLRTGTWKRWFQNEQLQSTTSYFNGQEDGTRIEYFASGEEEVGPVSTEADYKRGVLDGDYISYYDNADHVIWEVGEHNNNTRSGFWIEYFPTGEAKSQIEYVAGTMHGDVMFGHNSGQLSIETTYSSGKLHGAYTEYYDDRAHTVKYQGTHVDGMRDGKWTEWYSNGNLASETNYILGRLNGPASYYQEYDGSLKFVTEYLDDQYDGAYISYHFPKPLTANNSDTAEDDSTGDDETNYRQEFGRYELGSRVGEWFWLHGNGQTATQGVYFGGLKTGTWRDYNVAGELTRIMEFSDDQLISEQNNCHLATVNCDDE